MFVGGQISEEQKSEEKKSHVQSPRAITIKVSLRAFRSHMSFHTRKLKQYRVQSDNTLFLHPLKRLHIHAIMNIPFLLYLAICVFFHTANAQFGFFDQMFGGGHQQQQQSQQPQNVPSDSSWYQSNVEKAHCDRYLCPDTLACVHFPHHCPCPFPAVEDKFELGDGKRICVSRGGFKEGEAARKVELARKGLL